MLETITKVEPSAYSPRMRRLRDWLRWLFENAGNFALLGGYLLSAGFLPTLLSFSEGVEPWEYGVGGIAGLLALFVIRALISKRREWDANRRVKERISSDSSPFDPMESVFRSKRLFLKDLAPLGRNVVQGKHFLDCEIIGPGNAILGLRSSELVNFPDMRDNTFHDVNMVQIVSPNPQTGQPVFFNSVQFIDCHFVRCQFFTLNLLFFHRVRSDWNWITPDCEQPRLLEDMSSGEQA